MNAESAIASKAASLAVITVLRSSALLCAWGAFLLCLTPDFCFSAFKMFSNIFAPSTRDRVVGAWRLTGASVSCFCMLVLLFSILFFGSSGRPAAKARDVGCADELRRNFENSRHVGMLASVLLAVYANQLWNRCLCAFSGSRMPGFGSRAFRALQVWLLWMLLSQPSLLATPVALQLSANWFARDATCLVHHRKNIKTNAIRCIQLACGLHTAHASYSYRNSECEGILAVALCFWVGLLDATIVAHRLLVNKYLKIAD